MDKAAFDAVLDTAAKAVRPAQLPGRTARLPNSVRQNNPLAVNAASLSPMLPARQTSAPTPRSSLLPQSPGQVVPSQPSMQRPVSAPPLGTPASQVAGLSSIGDKLTAALERLEQQVAGRSSLGQSRVQPQGFGSLPAAFQERYRMRVGMGLNQGVSEQDAVNYYNQNYRGTFDNSGGRRLSPLSSPSPAVQRPQGQPQYVSAAVPRAGGIAPRLDTQNARYAAGAGTLADTLAANRVNRQGLWSGTPTPEAQQEYAAAVQAQRAANPDPRSQFLRNESGFRPGAGRTAVVDKLRQQYLLNPMTGGRSSDMGDRFARLDAIDPPGRARQESAAVAANQRSYREARDAAINAQLQQSGYNETRLREEALARRQPRMEFGGADAASLLAPRTRVTWEHGGKQHSMLTGPGRAPRTPEDEARSAYSRRRDVDAVRERLARARAARLAMRGYSY